MINKDLKKSIYLSSFKGMLSETLSSDSNVDLKLSDIKIKKNIDRKEEKRRKIDDEIDIPYEIPESWRWVKLGYLADVIRGLTFSQSFKEQKDNTILVLRGGNIDSKSEELIYDDNIYVSNDIPNDNQYIRMGDTLIVASSGTKTSVGKSAYITEIDSNVSFGGFMMVVRPYEEILNPKYLSYNIKMYRNKIINDTNGYISNITNAILNNLLIPLPPIEEQNRIVEKVDSIMEQIECVSEIEEEIEDAKSRFIEDIRKSILQEAFDGTWDAKKENWNENTLKDLCIEICTGNSISETVKKNKYMKLTEGYNYIATKDLEFNHTFNYENGVKIPYDEPKFKYANPDNILLCIEGGSAGRKIGILAEKVCYGNKLCKFDVREEIDPKFLYYYLQSPIFLKNFYDKLSGIIGGVSIEKIRKIKMKYPDINKQKEIVKKLDEIMPLINDVEILCS